MRVSVISAALLADQVTGSFRIEAAYSAFSGLVATIQIGSDRQDVRVSLGFRSVQPAIFTGAACPAFVTCFVPESSATYRTIPGSQPSTIAHAVFGPLSHQVAMESFTVGGYELGVMPFLNLLGHKYSMPMMREVGGTFGLARTSRFAGMHPVIAIEHLPDRSGLLIATYTAGDEAGSVEVATAPNVRGEWSFQATVSMFGDVLAGVPVTVVIEPGSESLKLSAELVEAFQQAMEGNGIPVHFAHDRLFIRCADEGRLSTIDLFVVTSRTGDVHALSIHPRSLVYPPEIRSLHMQDVLESGEPLCPLRIEASDQLLSGTVLAGRPFMGAMRKVVLSANGIRLWPLPQESAGQTFASPEPMVPVFGFPAIFKDSANSAWLNFARTSMAEEEQVFILRHATPQPHGRGYIMSFIRVHPEDHVKTAWTGNRKIYTSLDMTEDAGGYDPMMPTWQIPLLMAHIDSRESPIPHRLLVQVFEDAGEITVYLTREPVDADPVVLGQPTAAPTIDEMELPEPIAPGTLLAVVRTRSMTPGVSGDFDVSAIARAGAGSPRSGFPTTVGGLGRSRSFRASAGDLAERMMDARSALQPLNVDADIEDDEEVETAIARLFQDPIDGDSVRRPQASPFVISRVRSLGRLATFDPSLPADLGLTFVASPGPRSRRASFDRDPRYFIGPIDPSGGLSETPRQLPLVARDAFGNAGRSPPPVQSSTSTSAALALSSGSFRTPPHGVAGSGPHDRFEHSLSPQFEECSICADAMSMDDTLQRIAGCSHLFHRDCIRQWLETGQRSCPVCRNAVRLRPKRGYSPKEGQLQF